MAFSLLDGHWMWVYLLTLSRISAVVVSAPVFGTSVIPAPAKIGLAVVLSLALTPLISPTVGAVPASLSMFAAGIAINAVIGLIIGFAVNLIFTAFQIAGQLIDIQMGFSMINVLNPISQQQSSGQSLLMSQLAITVFLIGGGHLILLGGLLQSFRMIPPGGLSMPLALYSAANSLFGETLMIAIRVAAPALAVLFLTDVSFSILTRMVPQLNVMIVGMPVKIIFGLLTVSMALPLVAFAAAHLATSISGLVPSLVGGAK